MTNHKNNQPEDELENEDQWDYEAAEKRPAVTKPRAVVSVAFARDDFERVSESAEFHEMRLSEFIRVAALEKAARSVTALVTSSTSATPRFETRLSTPNQRFGVDERVLSGLGSA